MNLPEPKDGPGLRLPEGHMPEVSKMSVDNRAGPTPLMPLALLSPDRKYCVMLFVLSVVKSQVEESLLMNRSFLAMCLSPRYDLGG